jgi:hypothetical protein
VIITIETTPIVLDRSPVPRRPGGGCSDIFSAAGTHDLKSIEVGTVNSIPPSSFHRSPVSCRRGGSLCSFPVNISMDVLLNGQTRKSTGYLKPRYF